MKETIQETKAKTFGYISAALGFVAGLAWNEAIAAAIDALFPLSKDSVGIKFLYAVVVTVAVVILITIMNKVMTRTDEGTRQS
jgi:hypothetical protein